MTKAGFMNSDGWTESPASEIQRRDPFTSTPKKRAATIATMERARMTSAVRRT